jgi:hypothetical protein
MILPGKYYDAIRRAAELTATSEMTDYEVEYLQNGRQTRLWKSDGKQSNVNLTADLNFLIDGGFENWHWYNDARAPDNWKHLSWWGGSGTIERSTDIQGGAPGTYSAKIIGQLTYYQDVLVIPGMTYGMRCRLKGDGSNLAKIFVFDIESKKYWNGSIWTTSTANAFSRSTASWNYETETSFTVESPTGHGPFKTLRIHINAPSGNTGAFFDDIAIYPEVNFSSCHAHNFLMGETAVELRRSNDNFSSNDVLVTTFSINDIHSFYKSFTDNLYRWWRIETNFSAHRTWALGEWILGPTLGLTREWQYNWENLFIRPQTRVTIEPSGQIYVINDGYTSKRGKRLTFMTDEEDDTKIIERDFFEASEGGKEPIIFVPDSTKPECLFARIVNTWSYSNPEGHWVYSLDLIEDPFPELHNE